MFEYINFLLWTLFVDAGLDFVGHLIGNSFQFHNIEMDNLSSYSMLEALCNSMIISTVVILPYFIFPGGFTLWFMFIAPTIMCFDMNRHPFYTAWGSVSTIIVSSIWAEFVDTFGLLGYFSIVFIIWLQFVHVYPWSFQLVNILVPFEE